MEPICIFIILMTIVMHNVKPLELNTPLKLTLSNKTSQAYEPLVINRPSHLQNGFIISQVHTQYKTIVASTERYSRYGMEYNSTDSGILYLLESNTKLDILTYVGVNATTSVESMFFAIPSVLKSPVPGACCLTCALEIDPNIRITYDSIKTHISFSRASKFWNISTSYAECDNKEVPATFGLKYSVYYYYLDENDFTGDALFDGLWKMSNPESIKKVAQHLVTFEGSSHLEFTIETVFANGVIFNVIVFDQSTGLSSAYVPTSTYGCNFTNGECTSFGSTTSLTYCILFMLIGIVMCFGGFKLLRILLFLSGVVLYWFLLLVLLIKYCPTWNTSEIIVVSSACSLIGGAFVLFMYAFKKLVYLCILNICFPVGLFISAIIFYTPFGYFSMWNVDYQFALGLCCITLFISVVLLFYPKISCYLFSTLLGSYAVIMLPNFLLRANMHYIVVTVILRLTVSDFGNSYLRRPYQNYDYILTGTWAGLFLIGFIIQYFTTKNDDFVVDGKEMRQRAWQKFSESIKITRKKNGNKIKQKYYTPPDNERTLLIPPCNQSRPENLLFDGQPHQSNTSTFHSNQNQNDADLLPPSHSQESKEYQPLVNRSYGTVQPSAPLPSYNDERYPKIV